MTPTIHMVISCYASLADYAVTYFACLSAVNREMTLKWKWVLLWFVTGIASGVAGVFADCGWIDPHLLHIMYIAVLLIIVRLTSQERKLFRVATIFCIVIFSIMLLQSVIVTVVANFPFPQDEYVLMGVSQIISSVSIFYLSRIISLYRLVYALETRRAIKTTIFTISITFLTISALYQYSLDNIVYFLPYLILFFLIILVFAIKALIEVFSFSRNFLPREHDMKNRLLAERHTLYSMSDLSERRKEMDLYMESIGFHLLPLHEHNLEKNIELLIEQKMMESVKKLNFDTKISIVEPSEKIPMQNILLMYTTLLDNAIAATNTKEHPIISRVFVSMYSLIICVENECKKKNAKKVYESLCDRNTTKENISKLHGHGLPNLMDLIVMYQATFTFREYYNKQARCNYISLYIEKNTDKDA